MRVFTINEHRRGGAVELTSAAEVLEAAANGLVTIEAKPIVVNMPFLTWPGGGR